jgi:CheY-like chemotaxis protein
VLVAGDGRDAVALFRAHQADIDVVVLDVRMPNLGGVPALYQIRDLRPDVPAILMSGFTHPDAELMALLERGVRFVPKPLRAATLAELVCEMAPSAGEWTTR